MRFNSVKRGNFSGLAGHVNRATDQVFEAGRSTSVDHSAIAKEAIKGRSMERRAVIKAEADVSREGLRALGKTKETRDSVDAAEKIEGYKRPARRMAGVLGGLGTLAMTGALYKAEQKARKEESDARLEADQRRAEWEQNMLTALTNRNTGVDVEPFVPGTPPSRRSGGDGGSSGSQASQTLSSKSSIADPQAIYTYLTSDKGLSPNKAIGLIANIERESAFKLNNPGDGGLSNGLFQWHKGRLSKMQTAVPDWQTNWKGQIDYALSEPGESGNNYLNTTFDTPSAAGAHWTRYFERPADIEGGIIKQNEFIRRYNFT